MPADILSAYFKVLRRADQVLRAQPQRYAHLWARNVPPDLTGDHDWARFGLGELLVFEPYPSDLYHQTVAFARRWALDGNMREDRFDVLATSALTP
jgi:hypothetical protein